MGSKRPFQMNEVVEFKGAGVLAGLSTFFDEPVFSAKEASLYDLLYNLPHIHRADWLTIPGRKKRELFIPLRNCGFFRDDVINQNYFRGELTSGWNVGRTGRKLPAEYELDPNAPKGERYIRKKKRFVWSGKSEKIELVELGKDHAKVRRHIFQIHDALDY
jgi:hypothetical protein